LIPNILSGQGAWKREHACKTVVEPEGIVHFRDLGRGRRTVFKWNVKI
jgi:hypothetical protein